jgi:hypothetical protein
MNYCTYYILLSSWVAVLLYHTFLLLLALPLVALPYRIQPALLPTRGWIRSQYIFQCDYDYDYDFDGVCILRSVRIRHWKRSCPGTNVRAAANQTDGDRRTVVVLVKVRD